MNTRLLSLISLLILPITSFGALELNGQASYSKFNRPYFVGQLYLIQTTSERKSIYNTNRIKRMEVHIAAEKISPRKFNEIWTTGIAVNNSNASIEDNISDIRKFTESVKGNLTSGDVIQIEYMPKTGTRVNINDIELANELSPELFNMLLSVWIGDVPLSSSFRESILHGKTLNEPLVTSKNQSNIERQKEITAWTLPPEGLALLAAVPTKPNTNNLPKGKPTQVKIKPTKEAENIAVSQPQKVNIDLSRKTTQVKTASINAPTLNQPPLELAQSTEMDTHKRVKKEKPKPETKEKTTIVASKKTMHNNKNLKLYIPTLKDWVEEKVDYPLIVTETPNSKSLRFDVIIDRNGKVLNVRQRGSKLHSFAYSDALKIIESASPFPRIPESLDADLLKFQLFFHLHSRETNGELGTYSAI